MSILFDRTAANQRYTIPAYTATIDEWFIAMIVTVPAGAPTGSYILSSGDAATSNTLNLWISGANELTFRMNVGNTAGTIGEAVLPFEDDTPTLLAFSCRSGDLFGYASALGYPVQWLGVSDPVAGGAVLGAITLGAQYDNTDWFGGDVSYLAIGTPGLTSGQINGLTNGSDLRDLGGVTVDRLYWPTEETGSAPATVQNLINPGTGDMALAGGTPASSANPTFGDWTVTSSGLAPQTALTFENYETQLTGWRVNVASPDGGASYGIRSGTTIGLAPRLFGVIVDFDASNGAAVRLGDYYTGGIVTGCYLKGRPRATDFSVGLHSDDTLGEAQTLSGSVVEYFYHGAWMNGQLNASITGNFFLNQTGAGVLCQGASSITVSGNTVISDGKVSQRFFACLAAAPLLGSPNRNPSACAFNSNLVIVRDMSKIRSLAQVADRHDLVELPAVTFTGNTYVIPDTVDLVNDDIFTMGGSSVSAANATFAEWLNMSSQPGAGTVTGDTVIQLPVSEIDKLIEMKRNQYVVNSISYSPRRLDVSPLRAPNLTVAANRDFNFIVRDTRDSRIISQGTETTSDDGSLAITTGIIEAGIPCRVELVDPVNTQSLIQPNIESI